MVQAPLGLHVRVDKVPGSGAAASPESVKVLTGSGFSTHDSRSGVPAVPSDSNQGSVKSLLHVDDVNSRSPYCAKDEALCKWQPPNPFGPGHREDGKMAD